LATLVLVIGCSARPFLAHVAFANGQQAESRGDPARAVSQYQQAMRLDGWYAINTAVYKRIGAIDATFGRVDTFEYAIYHAELMVAENNYPAAVAEYERLVEIGGEHARFLKARCYDILNNYGTQLYLAGAIGDACHAWQEVLTLNPTQWLAIYCLSTAYFDTGRYQESIDMIVGLLKGLADPELRANLNSNLGDAYTRLGDYQHAHLAYRYSYFVDNILNWRALMSLVGSG
jgi:tetratricopeptide (TPR) repeat protein